MTGIKCARCDEKIATIHCAENDDFYCSDCYDEKIIEDENCEVNYDC